MKVLQVTNAYPYQDNPTYGVFIKTQIDSLSREGVENEILFINGKESKTNYLRALAPLWRKVRREEFDLIHAHYGFSGMVARLQPFRPLVVSFCGSDLQGTMANFQGRITRRSKAEIFMGKMLSRLAEAVIVKSKKMKRVLPRQDAYVIPNGVDLDMFKPVPREEARLLLELPLGKSLILFAGNPRVRCKRFDLAQGAYGLVKERIPDVEMLVLRGKKHELVPLYMNACDVLLLPSEQEGSPNVVKEALACNLPIVAADAGDIRDNIEEIEGNYVCEREIQDIAEKLNWVLEKPYRTNGREKAEEFEIQKTARRIIAVYEAVLNKKRRTEHNRP